MNTHRLTTCYITTVCSRFVTFAFTFFSILIARSLSRVQSFVTPWTAARQASLSITDSRSLLKLMSIESVMPSNQLILYCPLFILPSILPSFRVFSNEAALRIRWPKYWSFSFTISLSNEYSELISFRMDWLDLLAVQGTLKSSPTSQFKSISSLAFSLLYGPAVTYIYESRKHHSFDYIDFFYHRYFFFLEPFESQLQIS